jgi:hypothetical protein
MIRMLPTFMSYLFEMFCFERPTFDHNYCLSQITVKARQSKMSWIEDPGWQEYRGLNLSDLKVDEAYVNVTSLLYSPLWLYTLSDECYKVRLFSSRSLLLYFMILISKQLHNVQQNVNNTKHSQYFSLKYL